VIQIHYLNASDVPVADSTTVDVNYTAPGADYIHAGVLLAGQSIFTIPPNTTNYPVTGTCTWTFLNGTVNVYAIFPHMHRNGTHFHIDQTKSAAPTVALLDEAWNFGDQALFPQSPEKLLEPGDTIDTTCLFNNTTNVPIDHGESSTQEMCFDFFFYYPATSDAMIPCLG
jgi:hypothetical protein